MSCDRSRQIELADFLDDPRAASFRDFREHYPRCAECSAEVRAWTELQQALQSDHPDPAQLAQYASLEPQQRARIDLHTARCPSCREELSDLERFDPALLTSGAATAAAAGPGWLGEFMQGLRRLLWQPAFAYAIAGLLLLPVLYRSPLLRDENVVYEIMTEQAPPSAREAMVPEAREAMVPEAKVREEREARARKKSGSFAPLAPVDEKIARSDPQSSMPLPSAAAPARPAPHKEIARTLESRVGQELAKAKLADAESPLESQKRDRLRAQGSIGFDAAADSADSAEMGAIADADSAQTDVVPGEFKRRADVVGGKQPLQIARSPLPGDDVRSRSSRSSQAERSAGMTFEADALSESEFAEGAAATGALAIANEMLGDAKAESGDASSFGAGRASARDLVLRPDTLQTVRLAQGEALWLRIPLAFEESEAELRVADASNRHELRERVVLAGPPGRREARLRLPGSWLTPGRYSVLVVSRELAAAGDPPERFAFIVERR